MPSSITHSYFMKDVYDKLDDSIKNKIVLESAKTFAQGPDIFFFYNMGFGKKSNTFRNNANYMHEHNVNDYFINIVKYIFDNNLFDNDDVVSYLYGSICHYVLDSTMHPYVIYKTGIFDKNDKNTYKYNGLHPDMEYYLDAYMIFQNEKKEAKEYKMYNYILNNDIFDDTIVNMINTVIKDTYDIDNMGNIYNKCIKDMKIFYKLFNYDPYGIKKLGYSIIDFITPKRFIRKKEFSFYLTHNNKKYYLNLEKATWNHPCDKYETYNYSFIELYVKAIDKACNIIKEMDKILNKKKIDIDKISELIGNLSYLTGKDCNSDSKMIYFEF